MLVKLTQDYFYNFIIIVLLLCSRITGSTVINVNEYQILLVNFISIFLQVTNEKEAHEVTKNELALLQKQLKQLNRGKNKNWGFSCVFVSIEVSYVVICHSNI